ncbi:MULTISPECIES: hypothetical protein [Stutzerimonas stutzeri group]|jgi:hypothetical protein|uniref:hypothetical protein n=1 Tax=Stutzerimonas stutzeri group TaxID=136846 RepID=UPI00210B9CC6|nr:MULTISPECIES: hypothetical protein [Stutzerimonas stutzeri group]MCQ4241146.1 hypothetical protein [Stutzerimonas stutzeri]MDA0427568.1 hypothetical protein [Stutzerimonas frequens]
MKNFFDFISKKTKPSVTVVSSRDGAFSIPMDFEDRILFSSGEVDSFSEKWVNKELERSKIYFYEQLKEA